MASYQMNLRDYQRVLRKRYKIIIFTTLMLAIFSFVFAQRRVDIFSTTASVKIDDQAGSMANALLASASYTFWDNLATQSEVMKSFDTIELVAKRLDMIPEDVPSEEVRRDDRYINTIKSIQGMIFTQQSGNTNIIDITTTSTDPERARSVANTVAQIFRETHRANKQRQASETSQFIEESIAATEQRLNAVEDSLKVFQLTMRVPSIQSDAADAISRYNKIEQEYDDLTVLINQIDLELSQLIQRRDQSENLTKAQQSDPAGVSLYIDWVSSIDQESATLAILNNRLITLEFQKLDKLLVYNADHPEVVDIETQIKSIVSQLIREYTERVKLMRERQADLLALLNRQRDKLETLPDAQRKFSRLERDVALQVNVLQLLSQRQQENLIRKEDISDDVSIVKFATLPTFPDNANSNQVLLTGLIIGLMIGVLIAFVFEHLDMSIGTIEDVEEYLELPVLGIIPHIDIEEMIVEKFPHLEKDPHLHYYSRLISLFAPKTPVSESYRTLRTNLSFSGVGQEKPIKTLAFTSSSLQEGKSTTLCNLAIVTAQMGKRTLLIGCNLRRPSLYKSFGIKRSPGLTDIILGSMPWEDCVQGITDIMVGSFGVPEVLTASGLDNLYVIESGQTPPNPSELLASPQMEKFIQEVSEEFDLVYIDLPPTLPVTDSSILGPKVDGVVLTYQVGRVPRNALKRAKDQLQQVGSNMVGVVLNDVRAEITGFHPATEYFIHYYGEDFGHQSQGRLAGLLGGSRQQPEPLEQRSSEIAYENKGRVKKLGKTLFFLIGGLVLAALLAWQLFFRQTDESLIVPPAEDARSEAPASNLQFENTSATSSRPPSEELAVDTANIDMLIPGVIDVPKISVRSGPGTTFKEIGAVVEGDRMPIIATQQRWYRILLVDGRRGWIPMTAASVDTIIR
jgi:polysaccharide biosynthesis transport protein